MKFSYVFKNRKITIIFEPTLVQNHYVDQNLAEISPRTTKNCQFLVRAPDSINGDGPGAAGGTASSFDEHASTGNPI